MTTSATRASYWCYSCTRHITLSVNQDTTPEVSCPNCDGGFIEEIEDPTVQNPPAATPVFQEVRSVIRQRRLIRHTSFNPVIALHGDRHVYDFYYDDGSGMGLRPLPDSVYEILMGSGFNRLLEQLNQIEGINNRSGSNGNPPTCKSAIDSLPRVKISDHHTCEETNCAVCTEAFQVGMECREMPCKHIFHGECIVPWLSIRNSCPVCRFELPCEPRNVEDDSNSVGMTIWRLPGGGFAVGRFNAGMREGERILPVVLTEMDGGGFGSNEGPRRISWAHGSPEIIRNNARLGSGGRLRRAVRGMVSFMRKVRPNRRSASSSNTEGESRVVHRSTSLIRRFF